MSKRKQKRPGQDILKAPAPEMKTSAGTQLFPWAWMAGLILLTGLVFWPMLRHQFTNWDDEQYVLTNELLRGPDWAGVFSKPVVSNYHPLTVLSLALNYQVSKLEPFSYLLVNWALHLLNTGLVFYLIWLMSGRLRWVALFTAAAFALHPMHVESVAWVSERKDLLYTLFYLLALLRYWRYVESEGIKNYWLAFGLFTLSLLSKPAAVVLPLTLLLIDFWKGRDWRGRQIWLEKIPFLLMSLLFGILTVLIQSEKALVSLEKYSLLDRFFFGCYGLVVYLFRFFVPAPLSAFHPYPQPGALGWDIRLAPLALLGLIALAWYFRKNKALVFGLSFYAVNILLVVQFVAIGNTLLSERYTYMPYAGVAFAVAMLLWQKINIPVANTVRWGLVALVALVFGYMTRQRVHVWENSETLWADALKSFPEAPIPRANRANYRYQEALKPANAQRSGALMQQALEDCNVALAGNPLHWASLDIRSIIYLQTGKPDSALADAEKMLIARPGDNKGYVHRASAFSHLRRYDEALSDYIRVLNSDPNDIEALNGRGTVLFNGKQQYREALADFEKAIAIKPQGRFYLNRSRAHFVLGDKQKAREDAQTAQRLGTAVPKDYQQLLQQ